MTDIVTLRAVHHPTRRRIIDHLHLYGPCQVGTLARALDQQVGSISHHLRMLERAGVVEAAPELAVDGRTSWWRIAPGSISWSVDDFDAPADRVQAKAAERANIDHQLGRLARWKQRAEQAGTAWRRAAFSSDFGALATAEELADLSVRLQQTVAAWAAEIPRDDGQEREPVFVFAHGFPSTP